MSDKWQGLREEKDAYIMVCSLCEDIKEEFCGFGSEAKVIEKAEHIAEIAKNRKERLINNTLLNVAGQLSHGGPIEITLKHDEARLVKYILEEIVKKNYQI